MIEQSAPTDRVTCSVPGPRNDRGRPKLFAKITESGIDCWCGHCRRWHPVSRERLEQVWAKFKDTRISCPENEECAAVAQDE